MPVRKFAVAMTAAVSVGACSSAPRQFTPMFTTPPADQVAYQQAFKECRELVIQGHRSDFKSHRGTVTGVSVATGLGIGAVAGGYAAAAGGYATQATAAAVTGGAALLVTVPLAMYATSRMLRANKERELKRAMGDCLAEYGHPVSDWRPAGRDATLERTP